jgi:hypothetical protein
MCVSIRSCKEHEQSAKSKSKVSPASSLAVCQNNTNVTTKWTAQGLKSGFL